MFTTIFLSFLAFIALCLLGLEIHLTVRCRLKETIKINTSCLKDGFGTVMLHDGTIIKYRIEKALPKIDKITFSVAKEYCGNHSASLWQVLNEHEWVVIMNQTKWELKDTSFWIDGKMSKINTCSSGKVCRNKTESMQGRGLLIEWDSRLSSYSRLDKGQTSEKKCLIVEANKDRLWTVGYCELEDHAIVCLKRNC